MPVQPMNYLMGGLHHGTTYEGDIEETSDKVVFLRPPGDLLSLRYQETYAAHSMSDGIRTWKVVGLVKRSPQLEVVDILMRGGAQRVIAEMDDHGHVLKARFSGGKLDGGEPPFEIIDELYRNGVLDVLKMFGPDGEAFLVLTDGLRVELEGETLVWRG